MTRDATPPFFLIQYRHTLRKKKLSDTEAEWRNKGNKEQRNTLHESVRPTARAPLRPSAELQAWLLVTARPRVEGVGEIARQAALKRRVGLVARRCAQSKAVSQVKPIDLDVLGSEDAVRVHELQSGVSSAVMLKVPRQAHTPVPRQDTARTTRTAAHALDDDATAGLAVQGAQ